MSDLDGVLTFAYRGCLFGVPDGLAAPKKGSLFFCRNVAVVRGEINDLVKSDLDYALRRIENRYRTPFVQGHPLLKELQPMLEECLLIHSPAPPLGN